MSNNASSDSVRLVTDRIPDNPQEMLNEENYYYAGFFAAEMSCSVMKVANYNPVGHYYFKLDMTVSNADKKLLEHINAVVMQGGGVVTRIKGGFNLSTRGKKRVRTVLNFFDRYSLIAGDLAQNRISLIREALAYLEAHRGSREHLAKTEIMDEIRAKLRAIKETGIALQTYHLQHASQDAIGYFLAGVLDGEGSFGFKKSGNRQQPYFAAAMKDQKIIELLRDFIQHGNVRRRKDGLYHYEINHRTVLPRVCAMFLTQYPLRHVRQRERMQHLQQILNDYTRNPEPSVVHGII